MGMITISHIDEFIDYIKSGQLEKDFRESGEFQRGEILELLERIIEAGEMADETATRIIFKGLPLPVKNTN